jgi:hypothetical protein
MFIEFVGMVERFGQALTWPLVALIALPFVIWRIGAITKSLSALQSFVKNKHELTEIVTGLESISGRADGLRKLREELLNL